MGATKGFYSIVQYSPDAARLEAVNIGVALFCPDIPWLEARFTRRKTPIFHLFGRQEWEFLTLQQQAIQARLAHPDEFRSLDDFETYISRRANALRMTPPRPVKVDSPASTLDELMRSLVGRQRAPRKQSLKVARELGRVFTQAGLTARLRHNVEVTHPLLPRALKAPYAFQNGKLNLIEPIEFAGHSPSSVFRSVSAKAVEGALISDYPDSPFGQLAMVVVARFTSDQHDQVGSAQSIFQRHNVQMYTMGALDPLLDIIRTQAH